MSLTFGHVIISKLYGFAWWLARPCLRRNRRLADGFARRQVPDNWAEPADIWLQAASGGEAYLVWELLRNLPDPWPYPRILVTTWTRQGLEVLQGMAATFKDTRPDVHLQVTLFPLDAPDLMHQALRMVKPRVVVLLETELWPGLLIACARHHVPVLVLNGRISNKSLHGYKLMRFVMASFWQGIAPATIGAITPEDATRYAELFGHDVVQVIPNIKFDRAASVSHALSAEDTARIASLVSPSNPVLLLASVREEEELLLVPLVARLHEADLKTTLIIAPRHMHRVPAWMERLRQLPCVRRSSLSPEAPAPAGSVIVWDTFGELSALYNLAQAVFVGGSLAPLGGQNFLEPLTFGRIPCVGPYLDNFSWTLGPLDTLNPAQPGTTPHPMSDPSLPSGTCKPPVVSTTLTGMGLLSACRDARMLGDTLLRKLTDPHDPEATRARFDAWLTPRRGGTLQCVKLLEKILTK